MILSSLHNEELISLVMLDSYATELNKVLAERLSKTVRNNYLYEVKMENISNISLSEADEK